MASPASRCYPARVTHIAKNKVVKIKYVLRDGAGETLDESGDEPLEYLHGAHNIVPGLEKQLEGKTVGDKLTAVVPPEEGYGPRHKVKPQQIPRSKFPPDAELEKGMGFTMRTDDGRRVPVWIAKIQGPTVYVDPNHPLAGETLHFDVEVVDVRDANEEEVAHGHPHGPGGHHH
jgi:FKBP-type peptidyl-prolyl cis-trans isomerase SlyD